jgi:hypothetical protein
MLDTEGGAAGPELVAFAFPLWGFALLPTRGVDEDEPSEGLGDARVMGVDDDSACIALFTGSCSTAEGDNELWISIIAR